MIVITSAVTATITMTLIGIMRTRKLQCSVCGTKPALFRVPENMRHAFFGGWTCKNCGNELDGRGDLKLG